MFKKVLAASAAALVVGGTVFGVATSASAEDTAPVSTTQEVASSPSTDVAPDSATSTSDSAPSVTEPASGPAPSATNGPAIQTSPGDSPAAALPAPAAPAIAAKVADPQVDVWVTWVVDNKSKTGPTGHVSVGADYFDQTLVGQGVIQPLCEQLVQQDHYTGKASKLAELLAIGKLTWTNGHASDQDYLNVVDWNLAYGGKCGPTNIPAPTLTVVPPTCLADGTLPFLTNPAAQNPNGYEFPGLGYRVYISPAFAGPGVYTATIQKIGAGFDPAFPYGTKLTGTTTQTLTVLPHLDDITCHPPILCTQASSSWYSEDNAPVQGEKGLVFTGGSGAVDAYYPVTGNLQGFTGQSLTFTDVSGYQPSVTIVFNRTGSTGYANLVSEWYMNGGSAGQSGTFTADQSSLWWTNKIASGVGSQSDPQPLAFFSALWPTNTLISVGPHLGSAQTSETHSTITAISGCASGSYVPQKPESIVTHSQETVTDCDTKVDTTHHYTTTTDFVWNSEKGTYAEAEPVTTQDADTSVAATDVECPVTVVNTPTPTPEPTEKFVPASSSTGVLAHTGSDISGVIGVITGIALVAILFGIVVMIRDFRRRRQNNG